MLETVSMDLDECRDLVYRGVTLGMLQRLHRHIIVQKAESANLEKILSSGVTSCDELCLLFDCNETELLRMLSTESDDTYLNLMF